MNLLSWLNNLNTQKIILNKKSNFYPTIDTNLSKTPTTLIRNLPGMIEFSIGKMKKLYHDFIIELKSTTHHINLFVPIILLKHNKLMFPNNKRS
jgi:hypothetical protein